MHWNFVIDVHAKYDGFWIANTPNAKGIKLGFIWFFIYFVDLVALADQWKTRAEVAENKAIKALEDCIKLLERLKEASANADIDVLPERLRSETKQHAQDAGKS